MNDFVEIRKVIETIRKRMWLVVLIVIAAASLGYLISQRLAAVYQASTTIMVGQLAQSSDVNKNDLLTTEVLVQTYTDMALRQPVLQGVTDVLGLPEPWRLLKPQVHAELVAGTHLIQITVEAETVNLAQAIAGEVVNQLMLLEPTKAQLSVEDRALLRQQLDDLQKKIDLGRERLQTLESTSVKSFTTLSVRQVEEMQSAIDSLRELIRNWESDYSQILADLDSDRRPQLITVVEPAQARVQPIWPRTNLNIMLASVLGLLCGLALIIFIEFRDNRLKSTDNVNRLLGLRVLGSVSRIGGKRDYNKLLLAQGATSSLLETYRIIRSNIEFNTTDHPLKFILVTSPGKGEGKSLMVANLGIIMAHAGYRTIIVDGNLRQPVQHQLFQIANSRGLTEAIRTPELGLVTQVIDTKIPNLKVLTSGEMMLNQAELLGSPNMREIVNDLKQLADIVICDSPAISGITDASILANRADGVVLVLDANQTELEAAREAMVNLQQANANVIGVILNHLPQKGMLTLPTLTMRKEEYPSNQLRPNNKLSGKIAS